ncbi:MAG: Glu-tRNA(Gln) amidotransferase subunit GatE, partial [Sulfolobales archaeon]
MEINYDEVGLQVGLEVHQQLDTSSKLFCRCPTKLFEGSDEDIAKIERYLRIARSETGEVDPAALYEYMKGKKMVYLIPKGHVCAVELDEEPPHELNREALSIAVGISIGFKSKIVDEVHVMRKIVVDGSNTTGFQRTAIIALGGEMPDDEGVVRIQTICLEEDAARKVKEIDGSIIYNLDRLGIPLIEISTAPDIRTPEQTLRVASRIGLMLRLTGKAKRGLGTIRQDINVSIRGGSKIEIKGIQNLEIIDKVVEYEVMRQLSLLRIRDE